MNPKDALSAFLVFPTDHDFRLSFEAQYPSYPPCWFRHWTLSRCFRLCFEQCCLGCQLPEQGGFFVEIFRLGWYFLRRRSLMLRLPFHGRYSSFSLRCCSVILLHLPWYWISIFVELGSCVVGVGRSRARTGEDVGDTDDDEAGEKGAGEEG